MPTIIHRLWLCVRSWTGGEPGRIAAMSRSPWTGHLTRHEQVVRQLQRLYNAEINWSITTFWDGGFTAKLGDAANGFRAETTVPTFEEAVEWLVAQSDLDRPES